MILLHNFSLLSVPLNGCLCKICHSNLVYKKRKQTKGTHEDWILLIPTSQNSGTELNSRSFQFDSLDTIINIKEALQCSAPISCNIASCISYFCEVLLANVLK